MKRTNIKWISVICMVMGLVAYTAPFLTIGAMGVEVTLTGLMLSIGSESQAIGNIPAILCVSVIAILLGVILEILLKKGRWVSIFPIIAIVYNTIILQILTEGAKQELGYLSSLVQVQLGYGFFLSSFFFVVSAVLIILSKSVTKIQKKVIEEDVTTASDRADKIEEIPKTSGITDGELSIKPEQDEVQDHKSSADFSKQKENATALLNQAIPKAQKVGKEAEKWMKETLTEENRNKVKIKMSNFVHLLLHHKKKIVAVLVIFVCVGAILFAVKVISRIPKTIEIDLKNYYNLEFSNLNGEGIATGSWKDGYYNAFNGVDKEPNYDLEQKRNDLASSIQPIIEPSTQLKNGDTVKVTMVFDEKQAEESKVELRDTEFEVIVSGLPEAQELDLFEGLRVSFIGISPFIQATVDARGCSSFVQNNVEFDLPDSYLKNGDVCTVTAVYDAALMEKNLYKVAEDQKDFTVENCGEYLTSLEDRDLSTINQELIDKRDSVDAQESRTDPDWSYNNRVVDISVADIVDKDHAYLTDKSQPILTKQFLLTRKQNKIEEGRTMNRYCQIFEYTITARDYNNETTNQGKVYLVVWADNLYSEDGKMINWNPELGWSANTNLQQLIADTVTTYRDNYNVTEIPVE